MPDSKTVLIVDDDRELADGLRVFLQRHGFRCILANNGIDAQRAIREERPDLVVLGSHVSADALAVARANRDRLGLDVELVQADLAHGNGTAARRTMLNRVVPGEPLRGTPECRCLGPV